MENDNALKTQTKEILAGNIKMRKCVKQAGNRHANTQPSHLGIKVSSARYNAIENAISIEMKEPQLSCLSNFVVFH